MVDDFDRPGTQDKIPHGKRVCVVMAILSSPTAMKDFDAITDFDDVDRVSRASQVRIRTFIVARMDAQLQPQA
jgi:hypothetical protein